MFRTIHKSRSRSECTVHIDGSIIRTGLLITHCRTTIPTRSIANRLRIGSALNQLFTVILIAVRIFIPLISVIYVECTGVIRVYIAFGNRHRSFFIHFYFSTRQQTCILQEVHRTGKQVNLEVTSQRQVELRRVQTNRYRTITQEVDISHIEYHRTYMRRTIDVIHLNIVLRVIPLAHPCILSICHLIHQENSLMHTTHTNYCNIRCCHRHTHT